MPHATPVITLIAAAFAAALVLGFVATRLKLPALVGYLVAGILIGPATPGFVGDIEIASQFAEVGLMLLMFGVGLALSGASTVVLLKALESRGLVDSVNGRIDIGWLVVEDLAMVLVLVLLPPLAGMAGADGGGSASALWATLGRTVLQVAAFVVLMWVVGRRVFPWLLWQVARTGSRELFTLCVVAAAVSIAYGSAQLFGVSFALGAFFAGMVLRESEFSHRAAEETLPLRDAFAVLFFVSVDMLFDPRVLVDEPLKVPAVVGIIVLGKTLASAALVLLMRYPLNTALTVSAGLAQIGEFSFILAGLGMSLGVLPTTGQSLILAGALISIALNPLVFAAIEPALRWARAHSALARRLDRSDDPLAELPMSTDAKFLRHQVVLVGHGRVGQGIAAALKAQGIPFVVAEENREIVERLRSEGQAALLEQGGCGTVFVGKNELARSMTAHVLRQVAAAGR